MSAELPNNLPTPTPPAHVPDFSAFGDDVNFRGKKKPPNFSFVKRILKHAVVLVALMVVTLLLLYWQMLSRQMDYWWRHRTQAPVVTSNPNALFPGNKANFQVNPDHFDAPIVPPDNRLVIDKIEVNAPIVEIPSFDDDDVLAAIQNGVGHYPDTAKPGEPGNVFLTGHSSYWWWDKGDYKYVFQHLPDLVIGDMITVYYNQKRYDYKVTDMKVVKPKGAHVDELFDQEKFLANPVVRLMTCVPVGTSTNRLIVTAEQVK